ncbi:hypothetical protein A5886_001836 [Enterococcus sp. 8G7_MSG3316]|uniref:Uncharacterized protein n=1 Tax=Candidatus Enterococcus testudinis TaxID=1834191 RepID=A0A242A6T6_9ENTE|nr:hypothetical protein [Enterococcus sp. 8G7_MSG3316]OTN76757.1 hypothetical protein A5886_001836 [Enterococcus sp. 8G7_MSG3316]
MDSIENVNQELKKRLDKATKMQNQYKGLEEIEKKLQGRSARFNIRALSFDGYGYHEGPGGRLLEDLGIEDLDDVIKTLFLAAVLKRKQVIERCFSKDETELGIK